MKTTTIGASAGSMCFWEDGEFESFDLEEGDEGDGEEGGSAGDRGDLNKALKEAREANKGLKGQLDELITWKAQQEADAAEAAREKAEKDGEFKTLYEKTQAERDEFAAKYEALSTREQARIEAVDASNAERLSKLPEHLQGLTAGLTGDALAKQLTGLEKLTTDTRAKGGRGGGGNAQGGIPAEHLSAVNAEATKHGRDPDWWWAHVYSKNIKK